MRAAVRRVVAALEDAGVNAAPVEFEQSTRTAEDAAAALNVHVGQIVKSLVFVRGDEPVLVLVSGANRASLDRLKAELGAEVTRADAETVRRVTGYAIGGVPPVGHVRPLRTLVDADLLQYDTVYAASGTPNTIFPIDPQSLLRATGGKVVDIRE